MDYKLTHLLMFTVLCGAACQMQPPEEDRLIDEPQDMGADAQDITPARAALEVLSIDASRQLQIAGASRTITADEGEQFVIIELRFRNLDIDSFSVSSVTLMVRTDQGLDYMAHPESGLIDGACPDDALLSPSAEISCHVLFELKQNVTPTTIIHARPRGSESADVDPALIPDSEEVCQNMCDSTCVDVLSDQNHCGRCGNACLGNNACVNGVCRNVCVDRCDALLDECATQPNGSSFSYEVCSETCQVATDQQAVACIKDLDASCAKVIYCLNL